jgi:hypothetical protein
MSYLDKLKRFEKEPDLPAEASLPAVTLEPTTGCRPVYWESAGRIVGPGQVLHVAKDGDRFYICLQYEDTYRWVHEGLLRSRQAFEAQDKKVCNCCQGIDFWESIYSVHICRSCHPPASPSLEKGQTHGR